jgi:hypothetical protein
VNACLAPSMRQSDTRSARSGVPIVRRVAGQLGSRLPYRLRQCGQLHDAASMPARSRVTLGGRWRDSQLPSNVAVAHGQLSRHKLCRPASPLRLAFGGRWRADFGGRLTLPLGRTGSSSCHQWPLQGMEDGNSAA